MRSENKLSCAIWRCLRDSSGIGSGGGLLRHSSASLQEEAQSAINGSKRFSFEGSFHDHENLFQENQATAKIERAA